MASRRMIFGLLGLVVQCSPACGTGPIPLEPSVIQPTPAPSLPDTEAVYAATLVASGTCASGLRPDARERTYTATLRKDGSIQWSGSSLNSPPGHRTISSGAISGDLLSFSIDVARDPQSDDFHGLWEDFGGGTFLNISGKGSGVVRGAEITGTFDGMFAFYEPVTPTRPDALITGIYCQAMDHQFRFVKQ